MSRKTVELDVPIAGYEEGDELVVTAEYGDWHPYDVKLEPLPQSATGSIELTRSKLAFAT